MNLSDPTQDNKRISITPDTSIFYKRNIQVFEDYHPELADILKQQKDRLKLELQISHDEIPDVQINTQNQSRFISAELSTKNISHIMGTDENSDVHIFTLTYLLCHVSAGFELETLYKITECPVPEVPELSIPIYVIEPNLMYFLTLLCLIDVTSMLKSGRVLFFIGNNATKYYAEFINSSFQLQLPYKLFHLNGVDEATFNTIIDTTNQQATYIRNINKSNIESSRQYYSSLTPFYELLTETPKKPVILGFAPRFSTYLKHCMRDLLEGFESIGCKTVKYTERSNIERMTNQDVNQTISQVKPDIIIFINHFRAEQTFYVHEKIIFINWIQDLLPNILEPQFKSLMKTDLTFVFNRSWVDFLKSKQVYTTAGVYHLPVGFNPSLYFPIPKSKKLYDVVYISHIPDPTKTFLPIRENQKDFQLIAQEVDLINRGFITFDKLLLTYMLIIKVLDNMLMDDLVTYIFLLDGRGVGSLVNRCLTTAKAEPHPELISYFKSHYTRFYNDLLLSQKLRPISSLLESNINVRVYGRYWDKIEKFKDIHGGIAENGLNLNRILNSAKICINNSPLSFHMLALEALGAGAFLLSRKVKSDHANIFDFFSEDSETPSFTNELDIAKKVTFYLNAADIRDKCAQKAHHKVLSRFTYKHTASSILSTIKSIWEK